MRKLIVAFILLIFALPAKAHEGHLLFAKDPGVLPGEAGYSFDLIGEWLNINLFTLSTKQKQEKKLDQADERVAEIAKLLALKPSNYGLFRGAVDRYEAILIETEYMAEKIVVLDGNEINVAQKLEEATRTHEEVFANLLKSAPKDLKPVILKALNASRIENEQIFKFMVKNYQFNQKDIEKYKTVIGDVIHLVTDELNISGAPNVDRVDVINYLVNEARKYQKAGLNIEAYDRLNKAKNIIYSYLLSQGL